MDEALTPIVVGVDGSPASIDALRWACGIALARSRPVDAVTIGTSIGEAGSRSREAISAAFGGDAPEYLRVVLCHGKVSDVLSERSRNAYLLIVGSQGVNGSMKESRPHCPVVTMHHTHQAAPRESDATVDDTNRREQ